jgi:hypothetical protein
MAEIDFDLKEDMRTILIENGFGMFLEQPKAKPWSLKKDIDRLASQFVRESAAEKLAQPTLGMIDNPQNIIDGHLKKINSSFHVVSQLLKGVVRDMLRNSLNESDYQVAFNSMYERLQDIYFAIKSISELVPDNQARAAMVNNSMDSLRGYLAIINSYVKELNKGLVPEWFLKLNSTAQGNNWNFQIQLVYCMCVEGVRTFLHIVDSDIRPKQEGINGSFNLDSLDLLKPAAQNILDSLRNTRQYKEMKTEVIDFVYGR